MEWIFLLAVGLLLVVVFVALLYTEWMHRVGGYVKKSLPTEELVPLYAVYGRDEELLGCVAAYRCANFLDATSIEMKVRNAIEDKFNDNNDVRHVFMRVSKEPGYGAFRSVQKNMLVVDGMYQDCKSSLYSFAMLPLEIFIRALAFPMITLLDLVAHEGKLGVVFLYNRQHTQGALIASGLSDTCSVIECFSNASVRIKDIGAFRFEEIESFDSLTS